MNRRFFVGALGTGAVAVSFGMGRARAPKPKYIFYMIGDGMGVAHRAVADNYAQMKYSNAGALAMNQLPVKGMTSTTNIKGEITDSAAAGTAMACGRKTVNGALGMAEDLETPLRSIAYDAKDAGMKVGIITSVAIDHATPAAFYARVPKRNMYYEIDEFLANSGFDYFAGEPMLGRDQAKDRTPPEQLAKDAGYTLINSTEEFDALKPGAGKVLIEHPMGYAINGWQEMSLAGYTRRGIEVLDNEQGFFMMIEGGKIDWSSHANDLSTTIHETLAFDDAVSVALDFCKKHPEDSLLIVTADHETGGLQLLDDYPPETLPKVIDGQNAPASDYAAKLKQLIRGGRVTPNEAFDRLVKDFGLNTLSDEGESRIRKAINTTLTNGGKDVRDSEMAKKYGNQNPAVVSCLHELADQAETKWNSFGHTEDLVETTALGGWAAVFEGRNSNTDLAKILRRLITA